MFSRVLELGIAATVCMLTMAALATARELRVCEDAHVPPPARDDVRKALDAARCDVWVGAPVDADAIHRAAFLDRGAYVFVYRPRRLRHLSSVDDPHVRSLRIGVAPVGHGASPMPTHTLARRGVVARVVGVSMQGDRTVPVRTIAALAAGKLDVGALWDQRPGNIARLPQAQMALRTTAADAVQSTAFDTRDTACGGAESPSSFASYAGFRLCR